MAKKASMVRASAVPVALVPAPVVPLRLDLGCGTRKKEGFSGVDIRKFDGVDNPVDLAERVHDLDCRSRAGRRCDCPDTKFKSWPWKGDSVDEIFCSHFAEHLDRDERIHFANECYRIMKPGAKMELRVPDWSSARAYGDLTHQWPPMSAFWFYYLSKEWRDKEAPHGDRYTCDFRNSITWGFGLREDILAKNTEHQQFAMANYKDVCQEIVATLTKPLPATAG